MAKLVRFGVSMDEKLLEQFDRYCEDNNYTNRSEAIRDLIREHLVQQEWENNEYVAGAILFVFDHHTRGLTEKLTDIQHDYGEIINSNHHIHLDHNNCLEIIIVKGKVLDINQLFTKIKSCKGVMHCQISRTSIAKDLH